MRIILIEGSRGTGKSTLTRKIRDKVPETTLINPTGFNLDGLKGRDKSTSYYGVWIDLLESMSKQDITIVFDRFYFSEMVFSKLYKEYDFSSQYEFYNNCLDRLVEKGVQIDFLLLLNKDENEIKERLTRDKIPFWKVDESIESSIKQQEEYIILTEGLIRNHKLNVNIIDTAHKEQFEVYQEVIEGLKVKTAK